MTPSAPMLRHEVGSIEAPSCARFAVKLFGSSTWNMLESVKSRVAVSTTCAFVASSPTGGVTAILKSERLPPWTTTVVTAPLFAACGSALAEPAGAPPPDCATAGIESVSTAPAASATSGRTKRVIWCIGKRLRYGQSRQFEGDDRDKAR